MFNNVFFFFYYIHFIIKSHFPFKSKLRDLYTKSDKLVKYVSYSCQKCIRNHKKYVI